MRAFLTRMQWKMAEFMQGRHGADSLAQASVVAGLIFTLLDAFLGSGLAGFIGLALLAYGLFRCYSKNLAKRSQENEAFLRMVAKPKHELDIMKKRVANRKTTVYFTCKGCGSTLTVPKGKGTLRVTCPKCKTQVTKKS